MGKAKKKMIQQIMAAMLALAMVVSSVQTVPGLSLTAYAAENESDLSGVVETAETDESNEVEAPALFETGEALTEEESSETPEGEDVSKGTSPGEDSIAAETVTFKLHFKNTARWSKVSIHYWGDISSGEWPGVKVEPDAEHPLYYTWEGTIDNYKEFSYIFNNSNNGSQTGDLKTSSSKIVNNTYEEWVIWNTSKGDETVTTSAPDDWNNPIISPEVNGRQVTFRYKNDSIDQVYLVGTMNGWGNDYQIDMKKGTDGVHSCTITLSPGQYEYKFFYEPNQWVTDPSNGNMKDGGNSLLIVPGLLDREIEVVKGANTLPETLPRLTEDGETEELVAVKYELVTEDSENLSLDDNVITIEDDYSDPTVELTATATVNDKKETATVTLTLVEGKIISPEVDGTSVTFRYQDADATAVSLIGDWQEDEIAMKEEDDVFSCEVELEPGKYLYQFKVTDSESKESTINDPRNLRSEKGKSVVFVAGLVAAKFNVAKNKTTTLPKQLTLLEESGVEEQINVTYSVKEPAENEAVSVDETGTKLVVGEYTGKIVLIAQTADEEYTADIHINAVEDTNTITLKLHYHRNDDNYTGWNVWGWRNGKDGERIDFQNEGDEKVVTVKLEARANSAYNYIIRKSTESNEWDTKDVDANQMIDLSDVLSGTVHFYVESGISGGTRVLGDDALTGVKVISAELDAESGSIKVVTGLPIMEDVDTAFTLTASGKELTITEVKADGNSYELVVEEDLTSLEAKSKTYILTYDGYPYKISSPSMYSSEEFEAQFTYTGNDLGAVWTSEKTTFKVWAPTADMVEVYLYTSGTAEKDDSTYVETPKETYEMTKGKNGVWSVDVEGDLNGTYYTYNVTIGEDSVEACDPYARTTGVNGARAMVINLDATDPEGWAGDISPNQGMDYTDAVIYELHVRDFSIDASSGISEANKGKFLGLTETGTTNTTSGQTTGLDYLVDLGVNYVHLLPSYDYATVDETKLDTPQYNWGYDPQNYNVPEGSYSTDPYNGAVRVGEMKQMVKALHDNGISVIMDVVYNHVYSAEDFCFNQIVPQYFSRVNADGSYSNGSGCGNDTASERAMVKKYIVDSVNYWADEYHIDGFRFDLVGLLDTETINEVVDTVHEKHPSVIFYGEGWTMTTAVTKEGYTMATQKNSAATPNFAYFSDTMRDFLKGNNDANTTGFVSGAAGKENDLVKNFMATPGWTSNPTQIIQYASCHDNYTLWDKLNVSKGGTSTEDLIKMNNLTAAIYMTAEGIPLIHAGEELLRTKKDEKGEIIHNSYNSPDLVNSIKWSDLDKENYQAVRDYYKGLIAFRKNHAALRLTSSAKIAANVKSTVVGDRVVMFAIDGESIPEEVSDGIVVIFNASNTAQTFNIYEKNSGIAEGTWQVCINDTQAGIDAIGDPITDGNVTVAPISALVLVKGETEVTISKEELRSLIAKSEELLEKGQEIYTEASLAALSAVLETAKKIEQNDHATQEQIQSAVEALKAAIAGLKSIVPGDDDYSEIGYFVTFDYKYDSIKEIVEVATGDLIPEDKIPVITRDTRKGYEFAGWYKDETYKNEWNFDTDIVQANTTLYALWLVEPEEGAVQLYVQDIQPLTYTGSKLKPAVNVYAYVTGPDGSESKKLTAGKDYQVTYYNNLDAKTNEQDTLITSEKQNKWSEGPYVEIKAKGSYTGYVYKGFAINKADINDAALKYASQVANTSKQKVVTSLKYKKALKEGVQTDPNKKDTYDFTVEVKKKNSNDDPIAVTNGKNAATIPANTDSGTYTMTITGKGNYEGVIEEDIIVADKNHLMQKATVTLGSKIKSQPWKNGDAIELTSAYEVKGSNATIGEDEEGNNIVVNKNQVYTVRFGTTYLKEDKDFRVVDYRNNRNVGTATMIIEGMDDYVGTREITFKITGTKFTKGMKDGNIQVYDGSADVNKLADATYTGAPITKSSISLTAKNAVSSDEENTQDRELYLGKDYTITYKNNIKKGNNASVTFTATPRSGYTGSFTLKFKIKAADLSAEDVVKEIDGATWKEESKEWVTDDAMPYSPSGAKLTGITPYYGNLPLKEKTDYTVQYIKGTNYKKVAVEPVSVTLKGKGNYTGSLTVKFRIRKATIDDLTITTKATAYNAKKTNPDYQYTPAVTVKNGKAALKKNQQYTINYQNNTQADVQKYLNYMNDVTVEAAPAPIAEITLSDSENYDTSSGAVELPLNIYQYKLTDKNIEVVYAEAADFYYQGGLAVQPEVEKVRFKDSSDSSGTWKDLDSGCYDITYGANNKSGKKAGSIKITGKGIYGGTVTKKFEILKYEWRAQ